MKPSAGEATPAKPCGRSSLMFGLIGTQWMRMRENECDPRQGLPGTSLVISRFCSSAFPDLLGSLVRPAFDGRELIM